MVALNFGAIAGALGLVHRPRQVRELDHFRYIALARAPVGAASEPLARERPFCFRVLAPGLVYAAQAFLGSGLHEAFYTLSALASWAFLWTLFIYLREIGFDPPGALLGLVLAGLMPGAVRWYAYQYWMPDPLCLFLVTLGLWLAHREALLALAVVSVAGALTRESYVLVFAYAALLRWRRAGWRSAARALVVFLPAAATFVALRVFIVPAGGAPLREAAVEMIAFRARHFFDGQLYFATLGSFGVLVPLLLLRSGRARDALRARPQDAAVAVLAYLSLAFANNTDRLLVYALPVLLPPALRAVAACAAVVGRRLVVGVTLAGQGYVYAVTPGWGSSGLSVYRPGDFRVVVLGALLLGLGFALVRRRAGPPSS